MVCCHECVQKDVRKMRKERMKETDFCVCVVRYEHESGTVQLHANVQPRPANLLHRIRRRLRERKGQLEEPD